MPLNPNSPAAAIAAAPMTLDQKLELFRRTEDVAEPLPKLTVPEQKRLNMKFGYELETKSSQDEKPLIASAVVEPPCENQSENPSGLCEILDPGRWLR